MNSPINADGLARARRALMRRDPVLGAIIKRYGPCGLRADRSPDMFTGLIQSIISQQLSTKAAATIYARFIALLPAGTGPAPHHIVLLQDETMRGVGLSRQKISYLRDLSRRILDGSLKTQLLPALPDVAVIEALTSV